MIKVFVYLVKIPTYYLLMIDKNTASENKSSCCNAKITVSSTDEGTSCYVCSKCDKNVPDSDWQPSLQAGECKNYPIWICICPKNNRHSVGDQCDKCGKKSSLQAGGKSSDKCSPVPSASSEDTNSQVSIHSEKDGNKHSSEEMRQQLHEFAMNYKAESAESRKECIDKFMEPVEKMHKEIETLKIQTEIAQEQSTGLMEKNEKLTKDG